MILMYILCVCVFINVPYKHVLHKLLVALCDPPRAQTTMSIGSMA